MTWRLTEGRGGDTPVSGMATEVLAFVAGHPDGVRYAEVTAKFGDKAGRYLDRMRASGMVVRPKRGLYTLAPGTPPPVEPQGVAARTVTTMLIQLSAALDDAVKQGLVTRNVARLVKRPDIADARHTAATILLDSGAAVPAVAKWLGHDPAVPAQSLWSRLRRGAGVGGRGPVR